MERENRYVVIKRKDIELLTDSAKKELSIILCALSVAKQLSAESDLESTKSIAKQVSVGSQLESEIECVVVERHWPMYEQVWELVEDWVGSENA